MSFSGHRYYDLSPGFNFLGGRRVFFTFILFAILCVISSSYIVPGGRELEVATSSANPTDKDVTSRSSIIAAYSSTPTPVDRFPSRSTTASTIASTATSTTLPTSPQTSNKRADEVFFVNPSFFYSSAFTVQCRDNFWTLENRIIPAVDKNKIPNSLKDLPDEPDTWERRIKFYRNLLEVQELPMGKSWAQHFQEILDTITYQQRGCKYCICDLEGEMKGKPKNRQWCQYDYQALMCRILYGCECIVVLADNPTRDPIHNRLTWHSFQEAFNRIPEGIRDAPHNRQFRWVVPDNIAAYPGQAIGYDPDFRLNVFPPDQPPFYLEGPGPQLPVPPGSDGPRLGMAAPANQNLPPEDPNYDPFPVDIEEYAQQQANLWPLPGPNNQRNPAAEQEGFFPPDVPKATVISPHKILAMAAMGILPVVGLQEATMEATVEAGLEAAREILMRRQLEDNKD
ncbi:uncharacterized protein DFL_005191 [Arthrobotrys flagrans]|uniref:Uncharacterized protein n=1 Tax=Arthrobotrys flagrans TaxID=97331 RepID=A0A437A7K5_ARTFL|nr:hypothetical protein DFL_005191 [Arthrobotrys flagrans]